MFNIICIYYINYTPTLCFVMKARSNISYILYSVCACVCVCADACVHVDACGVCTRPSVRAYRHLCLGVCGCIYGVCIINARNKDQKLVGHFFEDRIFYRLLITVPLKMYRKYGRPKWILVS